MAGDHLDGLYGLAENLCCPERNKVMAGSVCSVASDSVGLVELPRQAVHVGIIRHGLVKCCVEHHNVRELGQSVLYGFDSHDVAGIVERG